VLYVLLFVLLLFNCGVCVCVCVNCLSTSEASQSLRGGLLDIKLKNPRRSVVYIAIAAAAIVIWQLTNIGPNAELTVVTQLSYQYRLSLMHSVIAIYHSAACTASFVNCIQILCTVPCFKPPSAAEAEASPPAPSPEETL
jgi:hypothetical protein